MLSSRFVIQIIHRALRESYICGRLVINLSLKIENCSLSVFL